MTEPQRRGTHCMILIKLMRTITQGFSMACLILAVSPMYAWAAPVSASSWHGANGLLTERPDNSPFMTHSDRLVDNDDFENFNEAGCVNNPGQGDNHPNFEFVCNRIQQTPLFDHYNP
ncbi:MAG: hypothetical protein OEY67_10610, partial [Gammaproteobacteria bacterium]|nr:hypothetical protein [Gammaproteobacteria bacterium]